MVIKKRAISDEQKEKRRQKILDCGLALFAKSDYESVSMAKVAKCASMAKGTVFLYFKTKEELFLAITEQTFIHWFDDLDSILASTRPSRAAMPKLMDSLKMGFQKHKQLVRLVSFSHIILEHNVSYNSALRYKRILASRLNETGLLLEKAIPFLESGQGGKLLHWMYAMVIGFGHMAEPSPIIDQVLSNEPDLRAHRIDFNNYFFDALQAILIGWQVQAKKKG